jgi:hypothetical protein
MSEQLPKDQIAVLKERASYHVGATPVIDVRPETLLALIECAERLKLVIAADDKAVAELVEMGLTPTDGEYFALVAGNKAAIANLEAL